jgi:DNA-binding transcriptional LysR family regulator
MHRRHSDRNIPTELLRALVTVVDHGGFTRACGVLNLTQSAVSNQLKRLSDILGGDIFEKGQGLTLTKRGTLVLGTARRILNMNDELLAVTGRVAPVQQLTIGLPHWMDQQLLVVLFQRCSLGPSGERVHFRCDRSDVLIKDLNARSIDLAFLCEAPGPSAKAVVQWSEQMCWAKSPNFVLAAGAPVPLISWPGTNTERAAIKALQDNDMQFFVAFSGSTQPSRSAAAAAGMGVLTELERQVTADLEIVRGRLPGLPMVKTGIFARQGLDLRRIAPLLKTLTEILKPETSAKSAPTKSGRQLSSPRRRHAKRNGKHILLG